MIESEGLVAETFPIGVFLGATVVVAAADVGAGCLQANGIVFFSFVSFEVAVLYFSIFACSAYKSAWVLGLVEIAVGDGTIDDFSALVISCEGISLRNLIF